MFEDGETTCTIDGTEKNAELKVVVWDNFTDTDDGTTYIADFDNIRLDQDQMVVSIAFVPDNTDVGMPPWAPDLPSLGEVDSGQLEPASSVARWLDLGLDLGADLGLHARQPLRTPHRHTTTG